MTTPVFTLSWFLQLIIHIPLAALGILLAFVLSCTVGYAWEYLIDGGPVSRSQMQTRLSMTHLSEQITAYQAKSQKLPEDWSDIPVPENSWEEYDKEGRPLDAWRRPFCFERREGQVEIYSLGRDGAAGGTGIDADLYDGLYDPVSRPSLMQYISHRRDFGNEKGDLGGIVILIALFFSVPGLIAIPFGMAANPLEWQSALLVYVIYPVGCVFVAFLIVLLLHPLTIVLGLLVSAIYFILRRRRLARDT